MKKYYGAMISVLWAATSVSMAQNPVPYVDTYEGYAVGSNLIAGSVWQGAGASAVVSNGTPTQPTVGYPVPTATHTNVMAFSDGYITNEFNGTTSNLTVVALDTMLKPVFAEPPTGDQMVAVSNSQMSLYISTNGFITVFHGVISEGNPLELPQTSWAWTTLSNGVSSLSAGQWVRLTVTMKYMSAGVMFKVGLNGQSLTSGDSFVDSDPETSTVGGPWFVGAKWNINDKRLNKIVLSGSGMLDDMVVATNEIAFSVMVASNGAPIAWMQAQGLTTNVDYPTWDAVAMGDQDNDGAATWAEHIAGTAPTNETSKLIIVSATYSNGAPILKWIGTTNALYPYLIQWSSNLMSVSSWMTATNNLPQVEGTNTVTLPTPASDKAFLRVNIPTP